MNEDKIRIKQYEQAADEKVSIGGIKWLRKWDVCIQCDSREEAETLRARLAQPENKFNPDWDAIAVMVEEQQRMAKRIEELEARLAQPEQEPVAWGVPDTRPTEKAQFMMLLHSADGCQYPDQLVPLYTAPPQREWVGLTDEEAQKTFERHNCTISTDLAGILARAIKKALKEKNK